MTCSKMIAGFLSVLCLAGVISAEQGIGLQADMIGQGLVYRLLSASGVGIEMVGRVYVFPSGNRLEYNARGELRVLKLFNPDRRVRFFIGGGAGYWRIQDWDYYWDGDDYTYSWETRWGTSVAALLGFDVIVVQMEDGSGLTLMPEVQLGYYTFRYEDMWIGPGVGIGLRYVW
ncbi:hypothetical protein ES703_10771 [subsurface metagenome]|nr:hypothetical protein [bacterium]